MNVRSWLVAVAALSLRVRTAEACAPAPPPGAEVQVTEEEAVIVWDAEHQLEHFIRKAAFHSTARSFGFLVPTPTPPELGESADMFYELARSVLPEVVYELEGLSLGVESWVCTQMGAEKSAAVDEAALRPAVRVISTAHVAGFDATTLEADDAAPLAAWLAAHGFATTPELTAWLERYVHDHWKITAFVVATDEKDGKTFDLATRAVRMSFHTDRPFYPYREPQGAATAAPAARLLRVFFVGPQRYQATLQDQPWSATVTYAAPLALPAELAKLAPGTPTTTVFVDDRAPRRGVDEVYFAPSADRREVWPPPIIVKEQRKLNLPIEPVLLSAIIGLVMWRRRKR